ncbi:phage head-tail joining protein [Rhodobacter ferrooxidans]|uniref:Uncharacterized protein n=1 Tax=Rhodobacter ferrooxidans TaxID=371731 RepID=C8S4W0_9RHOB|nr:hypothetical protein [Rhodobacter sp. SW2]EEW24019.1 conserved hypothetical protein [Rhodobacter sp. SW2]
MALEPGELEALRDELIRARARGVRSVQMDTERVEYKSDAEMTAAINDIEARIRRASMTRTGVVLFSSSKGL